MSLTEKRKVWASHPWAGTDSDVCAEVVRQTRANLDSYRINPPLLTEQVNIELSAAEGGYGHRQLYELIQNGADALAGGSEAGGRITVILTESGFYCANEGDPIDVAGVQAILLSHVSQKRGDEIGRFGLGFKSVLEVTDSPEFYSRSGSFAWNFDQLRKDVSEVVEIVDADTLIPRLRAAYPVDPKVAFAEDPILHELSNWATTIVKLPVSADQCPWLADDLASFPKEFLLFCPHVGRLTLDNRLEGTDQTSSRVITLGRKNGRYRLREDDNQTEWRIFSCIHEPSPEAREDAGTMSNRERVPIHWAFPLDEKAGPGVLWAFFPSEYETTLSGIVNAPWKTNPDRKNLLDGAFNQELLNVVSRLVVENLPELVMPNDPGRLLDIIPARGREARNWADRVLTDDVYERAAHEPSLPNLRGVLTQPNVLLLHPRGVTQNLLELWSQRAPDDGWCHRAVETRDRRPRAERLIDLGGGRTADWVSWLQALLDGDPIEGSKTAVKLAAAGRAEGLVSQAEIASAAVVLSEDGEAMRLDQESLHLPGDKIGSPAEITLVHPDLASDGEVVTALEELGIRPVDAAAQLKLTIRSLLEEADRSPVDSEAWASFWRSTRALDVSSAAQVIRSDELEVFVRVRSGEFRPLEFTLLPGEIVPDGATRDRGVAIDIDEHKDDLDLLRELGAVAAPTAGGGSSDESWFESYWRAARNEYQFILPAGRRPHEYYLGFSKESFAGPLSPLLELSDEGRELFSNAMLAAEADLDPWEFAHGTRKDFYPIIEVDAPVLWLLKQEGRLTTSAGPQPVMGSLGPALSEWCDVLPVARVEEPLVARLNLPSELDQIPDSLWEEGVERLREIEDDVLIGRFTLEASRRLEPPETVWCRVGEKHAQSAPGLVSVVCDQQEFSAHTDSRMPVLLVGTPGEATELTQRWQLKGESDVRVTPVYGRAGEDEPLTDRFPALHWEVEPHFRNMVLVPCDDLQRETVTPDGRTVEDVPVVIEDQTIYLDARLSDVEILHELAPHLGFAEDDASVRQLVERGEASQLHKKIQLIGERDTLEERLLVAVGEGALRGRLPLGLMAMFESDGMDLDGEEIARLTLSIYGVETLYRLRSELAAAELSPPTRWAGSPAALSFVRRLGFPREFAGFKSEGRAPLLEVEGPPEVPDLHDYQRIIADAVGRLIRGDDDGNRGLLSLPTGAGKTRVAVEAIIESIQAGDLKGPVLWVTQSDELCEQAVQTWSYVWRGIGAPRASLAISRLWGSNEIDPVESGAQVVIATIQKLQPGCIANPRYEWLSEPGCVVVDEAHHSITTSYTALFRWLGLEGRNDPRPLIGLTATPFRGTSASESERLVRRYHGRRLDENAFDNQDPYSALQDQGILAKVVHRELHGIDDFDLTQAEVMALETAPNFLPPTAEGRLGLDVERNKKLLQEILTLAEDRSTLVFAASVEHAETMAALLATKGVSAQPISGKTEGGARRHYIEEFRRGTLRVLTNYAVLTQGFDAPAVRAVVVARPTYSPTSYQQMIGRGLRGPRNGGEEECVIVDVRDNIRQFGKELAFREFEYLWDNQMWRRRETE